MTTQIVEDSGVLLQVTYDVASDGVVVLESVHALGTQYQPVGPDLIPLFDKMLIREHPDAPEAEAFLSKIAGELQ